MNKSITRELGAVAYTAMGRAGSKLNRLPTTDDDSDRILITAIALGDQVAFGQLHSRYERRIERFITRKFRGNRSADEIANETLWIVWRSAGQFKGTSKVCTWIMGIAYHMGLKGLRKAANRPTDFPERYDSDWGSHNPSFQRDISDWITAGLARLPDEQRTALELAYHLGHSCDEIAVTLDCPVGTVKTRLYYGRRRLKQLLPQLAGLCQHGATCTNRPTDGEANSGSQPVASSNKIPQPEMSTSPAARSALSRPVPPAARTTLRAACQ
jgi:RNA polymerase sigma-70 factor (ECF subfamily)